jgi:hypothetical protein
MSDTCLIEKAQNFIKFNSFIFKDTNFTEEELIQMGKNIIEIENKETYITTEESKINKMSQKQIDKKIEQLTNKKSKLETRCYEAQLKENEKLRNIGWGTGMRGYKKLSSVSFSKSEKIENQIKEVEEELKILRKLSVENQDI